MKANDKWNYMYNLLVEYKKEYGNTEASIDYVTKNGKKLGTWVYYQRSLYKKNKLSVDRIEKLGLLNFRFDNMSSNDKWNYMYNLLVEYKEENGNTDVPVGYVTKDGKKLGKWVNNQIRNYKIKKLSMDKIRRLQLIEFSFDNSNFYKEWNNAYNLLVKYKKEYGNTDVPIDYVTEDGVKLGIWVYLQWAAYKNNKLSIDKINKLKLLDFMFESVIDDKKSEDSKLIAEVCINYNIDYMKNKLIFDKLSYKGFVSRLYYILDNHMYVVDNNGNLNIIFYMNNDSLYLSTGYTMEELILYYSDEKIKTRKR